MDTNIDIAYSIPNKSTIEKNKYIKGSVKVNLGALNGIVWNLIEKADFILEDIIFNMLSLGNRFTMYVNPDNTKHINVNIKRKREKEEILAEVLRNGGSICVSDNNNRTPEIRLININDYYTAFIKFSGLYPNSYQAMLFNDDTDEDYINFANLLLYGK